ncbi:AcrR family transcriptional regulator [Arthrobacter sp. B3I9]|uniref:hypothetical protein n=1 Tax=Arthrobacter sp. B3I9 TaxID=3042270 RepID=UPI00279042EB|nr:hypothetical protein [Arthrobacter sp. B3I9]MDQ0851099.1 AcrR family transcriptional regulator [Arthrobacter sp. B3I9]
MPNWAEEGSEEMRQPVHYLESTDSIRSRWDPTSVTAVGGREAHAQLFIETLLSIALGRDIAIQQSFAFDSYAFQMVLVDFKAAHDAVAVPPALLDSVETAPILLHLHNVDSFAESVASNLRRMAPNSPGVRPFFSSLYPDLHDRQELLAIADDVQHGAIDSFTRLLGDVRAPLFEDLWAWFGGTRRANPDRRIKVLEVKPPAEEAPPSLGAMLSPLLDPSSPLLHALKKRGYWDKQEEIRQVIEALQTLHREAGTPSPFADRSLLYGHWNWHGATESAESLVGSKAIGLVREVISTLYNQVTVDSMSLDSASFSTPMSRPGIAEQELAAQQLALWSRGAAMGHDPWSAAVGDSANAAPDLEVHIDVTDQDAQNSALGVFKRKDDTQRPLMREAFEAVLQFRKEPRWQTGIDRIRAAVDDGDKSAIDYAVDAHVASLADALSGKCVVGREKLGGIRVTLPVGAALLANATEYLSGTINPWLGVGAAGLAAGILPVKNRLAQRAFHRNARTSLGQLVQCREIRR